MLFICWIWAWEYLYCVTCQNLGLYTFYWLWCWYFVVVGCPFFLFPFVFTTDEVHELEHFHLFVLCLFLLLWFAFLEWFVHEHCCWISHMIILKIWDDLFLSKLIWSVQLVYMVNYNSILFLFVLVFLSYIWYFRIVLLYVICLLNLSLEIFILCNLSGLWFMYTFYYWWCWFCCCW